MKWNKPDRERQVLHDLTYMWNLRKEKVKLVQRRSGCQGLGSGGNREGWVKVPTFSSEVLRSEDLMYDWDYSGQHYIANT